MNGRHRAVAVAVTQRRGFYVRAPPLEPPVSSGGGVPALGAGHSLAAAVSAIV